MSSGLFLGQHLWGFQILLPQITDQEYSQDTSTVNAQSIGQVKRYKRKWSEINNNILSGVTLERLINARKLYFCAVCCACHFCI